MSLCFEHDHNPSPVLDQPGFLFPEEGRPDLLPAQLKECEDNTLHTEAYQFDAEPGVAPVTEGADETLPSGESVESAELAESEQSEATVAASGSSVDRLYSYLSSDFGSIDSNKDGKLEKKELDDSLATMTNKDELQLLAWMGKNLDALEKLGDKESGISMNDLAGLNTAINKGTDDIGFAFRNTDWLNRGTSSVVGGMGGAFALAKLEKTAFSVKGGLGWTAAVFGGLTAIDAIGYYIFDKPKLDQALKELNEIPTANANRS